MKKLTKLMALLCILALGIGGLSLSAYAKTTDTVKTDVQQLGEGADLIITSAMELKEFASKVNNGNSYAGKLVVLANDIAFDGVSVNNFTPINGFAGTFDGQGYSISGIKVVFTTSSQGGAALFSRVDSEGIIQNVTVKNSTFQANSSYGIAAAGIAASSYGTINNCIVMATEINTTKYTCPTGGIVGYNSGKVINCYSNNANKIFSAEAAVGGIVGDNRGYISNCVNLSPVSNNSTWYYGIGGIAGESQNGTIENCYNTGTITSNITYQGGIVGNVESGIVSNCYALDTIFKFGAMNGTELSCKAYTAAEMQAATFLNLLNANRGSHTEWLAWEKRSESAYPLLSKPKRITECNISVANCVYNGEEQTPAVVITDGGKTLTQGTDYTVTYSNNKDAGTGTAVVSGSGAYMGSIAKDFIIEKAEQTFQYTKSYSKTYGSGAFYIDVKQTTGNGKVTYQTSNKKVADINTNKLVSLGNIGKATISVTAAETDNYKQTTVNISVVVKPRKMSITSATVSGGCIKVRWLKNSKVKGYQIQYSTDKKFKKNVTTATIKKKKTVSYKSKKIKKGKTYYVRIRAFKGGAYGTWSKKVQVKRRY